MKIESVWLCAAMAWCIPGCITAPADDDDPMGDEGGSDAGDEGGTQGGDASEGDDAGASTGGEDGEEGGSEDDSASGDDDEGSSGASAVELHRAQVTLEGVESLSGGFHYELWAIIDDAPATVGKFNIDAGGVVVDLDGIAIDDATFDAGRDLSVATDFVLTIETAGDVDILPGVSKYLAGPLEGDTSELVVGDARALGDDYSASTGQFILATPTNGADSAETAGVWWLDLSVEPAEPGFGLPELPEGWVYEGWAVVDGVPLTTGRFVDPASGDLDAPFSGPEGGPPVPGEDFLYNAPDGVDFPAELRGQTIVLTIEPEPDFSDAPFTLKPLYADVDDAAASHQNMPMHNQAETFPTMSVVLSE